MLIPIFQVGKKQWDKVRLLETPGPSVTTFQPYIPSNFLLESNLLQNQDPALLLYLARV